MTKPNWADEAPPLEALTDTERQELEALRAASRREHVVTDFSRSFGAISPSCELALTQLASLINAWMQYQGFWESGNFGEKLALVHSELSEALEAHRNDLPSDHIQGMHGVTEELADALIRILDLAQQLKLPIGQAVAAKMQFNFTRPYKHGKAY